MSWDDLVERLRRRASLTTRAEADGLLAVTCAVLAARLGFSVASSLWGRLPDTATVLLMDQGLELDLDQWEIYRRVAQRGSLDMPTARRLVPAAVACLAEAAGPWGAQLLARSLPGELALAAAAADASQATTAVARSGLSEPVRPTRAPGSAAPGP